MTQDTYATPVAAAGDAPHTGAVEPSSEELLARAWAARAAAMPLAPRPPRGVRMAHAGGAPLWAALAAVWLTASPDPGMARRPSLPAPALSHPSGSGPAAPAAPAALVPLARHGNGMKDARAQASGDMPATP